MRFTCQLRPARPYVVPRATLAQWGVLVILSLFIGFVFALAFCP